MTNVYDYSLWPSRAGEWEGGPVRGASEWDNLDFHVDLGCGRLPKARIGVDRYPAPGVAVVADLDSPWGALTSAEPSAPGRDATRLGVAAIDSIIEARYGLPFGDSSIKSIISHHFFEHVGDGFIPLMDEIYRVLEPGGILRAITPLFPSWSAMSDPDHRRYFMADGDSSTWDVFCGTPGDGPQNCWLSSFSVPYTKARFEKVHQDYTAPVAPEEQWTPRDARELRVALKAVK